jgi:beta-lactamase regulating signal transducer with metallopeptidase domain/5-hydroxyisourate hydrolase-like protein (transthyretin family)
MMHTFVIPQLANRAGWTLVHFLWQGALIAAITAGVLRLLSRRTAQLRYVVGVSALFIMIATPAATFAFYAQAGSVLRGMMLRIATAMDPAVLSRVASATVLSPHNSQWTTWVVFMWFAGVVLSSLRIVVGWRLTRQLLQTASDAVPDSVKEAFASMKERMSLTAPVKLLVSERIDGPAAIGWLKPVVLLPLTAITGLDPAQLQAVLAHELAHIRRHDFFVNVLQLCVESVLFYHPAAWWLSRRIRTEREHVCDDMAVAACGDPEVYVKALVELERSRSNVPEMAMAAARGSLKARVRRIFGWTPEGRDWREAAMAAMFVLTVLVAVAWQTRTIEAQSTTVHVTAVGSTVSTSEAQSTPAPTSVLAATLASLAPSPAIAAPQGATQNLRANVSIRGVVANAFSGEPIEGARVTITPGRAYSPITSTLTLITADQDAYARGFLAGTPVTAGNPSVITDSQGRFVLDGLDAGSYGISIVVDGFVRQEYGQRSPDGPGTNLILIAGQPMKDLSIRMTPASTIFGMIRNNNGKPAVDVPVQLLKATYNSTGTRVTQVVESARTDDRGQYRLYWVTPGSYYLYAGTEPSASGPRGAAAVRANQITNGVGEVYSMTYYPGVSNLSEAKIIEVRSDAQVIADLVVTPRSVYKVSGRVIDTTTGKPAASAMLSLVYRNMDGSSVSFASGSTYNAATGDFELRNVSPGSYDVQATMMQLSGSALPATGAQAAGTFYTSSTGNVSLPNGSFVASVAGRGRTSITVTNADVRGVVVDIISGLSLKGKLSVEGQPQPADLASLRVQILPSAGGVLNNDAQLAVRSAVASDGTFHMDGVLAGEYRFTLSPFPVSYYIKEVRFGSAAALNAPISVSAGATETLDVVLSPRVAQIDGMVNDDKGKTVEGVQAVLVPDAHRDRYELFRAVVTDPDGHFTMRGVPPGDYRVFAWESIESYGYFDPELLKRDEAKGQRIKIQESDKLTVSVKMIPFGSQQ